MYHYQILYVETKAENNGNKCIYIEICSKFLFRVIKKAIKNH